MKPSAWIYLCVHISYCIYRRMKIDEVTEEILEQGVIPLVPPPVPTPTPTPTPTPKLEKPYTVKCSLIKFCKDEALRKHLSDAALNMYELVVEVQQLMNLALRVRFEAAHKKGEVPHQEAINEKYVQKYFYAVTDQ